MKKIEQLIRPSVRKLSPYVCARDLYKSGEMLLDANENSFGSVLEERAVALNRYPDSDALMLRQAIAKYSKVKPENVIAGNGSDEIISMAINTFVEKGDQVITLAPDYSMYGVCAEISGAKVARVELDDDFQPNLGKIIAAADSKTKLLMFASPNSPTGAPIEFKLIERLLESFEGMVFLDEAYYEFYGKSAVPLLEQYENLIISRTLSKAWGLASLRIGYAIANEKAIAAMRKIKPPYNIGGLSQYLALNAVKNKRSVMLENVDKTRREREFLSQELSKLGFTVFSSVTNFLLMRLPEKIDSKSVQEFLAGKGVIVRDCSAFPKLENCIRITVGTRVQNKAVLKLLEAYSNEKTWK